MAQPGKGDMAASDGLARAEALWAAGHKQESLAETTRVYTAGFEAFEKINS